MAFQEAFKVVTNDQESKLEVNTDALSAGKDLEGGVRAKADQLQKQLDSMQDRLKADLGTGELKAAWKAIESELEASIPDNFKGRYESADWPTRATMIQTEILDEVGQFMQNKLDNLIKA